jgi:hypothetical protein
MGDPTQVGKRSEETISPKDLDLEVSEKIRRRDVYLDGRIVCLAVWLTHRGKASFIKIYVVLQVRVSTAVDRHHRATTA